MNNTCNRICLYNTCQNRVSSYTLTNPPPGCATHWFHSFMQFFFSVHETNGFLERVSTAMTINRYQKQLPTVELLCSLIQATHIYYVSNGALLIVSKETQLNSEYYPHIFTWYIVCHCIELKFEKIFIFRDNHPCQPPLITFLHPFWVGGFFFSLRKSTNSDISFPLLIEAEWALFSRFLTPVIIHGSNGVKNRHDAAPLR